jgi:transcription antitermination factor NusG
MSEITMLNPAREQGRWYALTVRHQHERQTEKALRSRGLDTLVPLYRSRRQWSDRVQELELPLFTGYVLCRFAMGERIRILSTPGVASIVAFGGRPAPLEEAEIAGIEQLLDSKLALAPWPYLQVGDRVRVERGAMRGLEGTLLRTKDGLRLVISVELLQRSIAVELDQESVVPVKVIRVGVA